MSGQTYGKCPLCMEEMDWTDNQLKPCKCGYEVCLWCFHRIMGMDQKDESGGRCPGCRSVYNKDKILEAGVSNQILAEICADKSNYQKEETKSHKQTSSKVLVGPSEQKDPNSIRVIQRNLVYIVGMPSEFGNEKLLKQKDFFGQYGKIESIIVDNIGANQQIPDSGRVYVTYAKDEEAVRCIQAVNGYNLDGKTLKATFGVTRFCHIWQSNKVCYKTNCSYVHHKVPAEDICSKDDVSVVCARLQHLMGIDTRGLQHRSGRTLPPPGDCSSRAATCNGISKDICTNSDRLLHGGANKNPNLLSATSPKDSSISSGGPSTACNDHENIHSNQQDLSDPKSQKYIPPGGRNRSIEITTSVKHMQHSCGPIGGNSLQSSSTMSSLSQGPKRHVNEQLGSSNDKSQAWPQVGNDTPKSKQMASAENGASDTSRQKPQYVSVVSQGQVGSGRRMTVLTRQMASTDTRSKATAQVNNGASSSIKSTLVKSEHSDCTSIPGSQKPNLVSHSPERPSHLLASADIKTHTGEEKKKCSDISEKVIQLTHKQLADSTLSHRSTAMQSMSSRPVPSNLSASDAKSQASAGLHNLSDLDRKLASQNQLQLANQQNVPVSNTGIVRASPCHSVPNNQVPLTDSKHQNLGQVGHAAFYKRELMRSSDIVSSHCSDSTLLSRSLHAVSSADVVAPERKERKRRVCPPGFEKPHHYSDSNKYASMSSPACSGLQDSCGVTDQPDITSWATDCLKDDGDVTQNLNTSFSSRFGSTDTIWRHTQFPGTFFSDSSKHPHLSPYPSGLLNPYHKPECWDGTNGSCMPSGGYDASCPGTSGMRVGMAGTLLQRQTLSSSHDGWSNGNTDSGMRCPQVDIAYPMYTLF